MFARRLSQTNIGAESHRKQIAIYAIVSFLLLGTCFFAVEHGWRRSVELAAAEERYSGDTNVVTSGLSKLHSDSASGRLLIFGFGLVGFWIGRDRNFEKLNYMMLSIIVFLLFVSLSVFWSVRPIHTAFKLVVLGVMTTSAFGLARALSRQQLMQTFAIISFAFVIVGFVAEISLGTFRPWGDYRLVGTTHPNTEAIFGTIVILFAPTLIVSDRKWIGLMWTMIGFGVLCIILTKSRTNLAAALFGISVMQVLRLKGTGRLVLAATTGLLVGLGSIAVAFMSISSTKRLFGLASMGRTDDVTSLTGRLPLWEELGRSISKSPMLGYGYLGYWDVNRVETLSETFGWEIPHGHNMYLDVALDVGLVGLGLFLIVLIASFVRAAKATQSGLRLTHAAACGLIASAATNGLAESLFKLPGWPTFVLVGVMASYVWKDRVAGLTESKESSAEDQNDGEQSDVVSMRALSMKKGKRVNGTREKPVIY